MNSTDKFTAQVQAILSVVYLFFTFVVIIIYELDLAHMSAEQDKSFQTQINFLTGGALIILYFWFQRAKAQGQPDAATTTTTSTVETKTTPSPSTAGKVVNVQTDVPATVTLQSPGEAPKEITP